MILYLKTTGCFIYENQTRSTAGKCSFCSVDQPSLAEIIQNAKVTMCCCHNHSISVLSGEYLHKTWQHKMICQIPWRWVSCSFSRTCAVGLYGCTWQSGFGYIPFLGTSAQQVWWASSFSTCLWWSCSMCWGTSSTTISGVSNRLSSWNNERITYSLVNPSLWLSILSPLGKGFNKKSQS